MTFYLIVRGPLGVGKTTVSGNLALAMGAKHIEIDEALELFENEWEDGFISQASFIRANELVVPVAREQLEAGRRVIFDGNFYHLSQLEDLFHRLEFEHMVFTLTAPLGVCIQRDSSRELSYGAAAATDVYRKTTELDYGTSIDATKSLEEVVDEIISRIGVT